MQIEAQRFLDIAERASAIAFFDLESTGLNCDYNSVLCVSVKPYGVSPMSFAVKRPGFDSKVVRDARDFLAEFPLWVSYYGRGFDVLMLNGRLLKHGDEPLPKHHHLDMYYCMRYRVNTGRRSQAHLLEWLGTPEKKMTLSPDEWNAVQRDPRTHMPILIERCESDVAGLEALYKRTRHLVAEISR
jgi:RNase H-like protein